MAKLIPMSKKRTPRKTNLEIKEFSAFVEALTKESDRGAVLISAALLEDLLERCIRSFLLDDERVDQLLCTSGPLGTLWARSIAALLLGILSETEFQECESVRKVRNAFAHGLEGSFENQRVKDICSNFVFTAKPGAKNGQPRSQYLASAIALLLSLSRRPTNISKRRLHYVESEGAK